MSQTVLLASFLFTDQNQSLRVTIRGRTWGQSWASFASEKRRVQDWDTWPKNSNLRQLFPCEKGLKESVKAALVFFYPAVRSLRMARLDHWTTKRAPLVRKWKSRQRAGKVRLGDRTWFQITKTFQDCSYLQCLKRLQKLNRNERSKTRSLESRSRTNLIK